MLSMMESVVTDGGGKYGQVTGYSVAGKQVLLKQPKDLQQDMYLHLLE